MIRVITKDNQFTARLFAKFSEILDLEETIAHYLDNEQNVDASDIVNLGEQWTDADLHHDIESASFMDKLSAIASLQETYPGKNVYVFPYRNDQLAYAELDEEKLLLRLEKERTSLLAAFAAAILKARSR